MENPLDLTALPLAEVLRSGAITVTEHTTSVLSRIDTRDTLVNAFAEVTADAALAEAERLDAVPPEARGQLPLFGVPVAIKNEIDVRGVVTRFGGAANVTQASEDAESVRRLRAAGAVVVGVTNQPEFGQAAFTEGAWGHTRNPWRDGVDCAGSSGGSAVAVATGMVPIAMGSDGGGSIRLPAAAVGIVGLKPTRGRVSAAPNAHLWYGLGTYGPLTRDAADAAAVLDVLAGSLPVDMWPQPPGGPFSPIPSDGPLRIAWTTALPVPVGRPNRSVTKAVEQAAAAFGRNGHQLREFGWRLTPRLWAFPVQDWLGILAEVEAVERPDLLERRSIQTARLARRLPKGALDAALRAGEQMATEVDEHFGDADVLVLPVRPDPPLPLVRSSRMGTLRSQAASTRAVSCTSLFNLTGHPAAAVPCGFTADGRPLAVQIVGRHGREVDVLRAAQSLESAMGGVRWPIWPPRD